MVRSKVNTYHGLEIRDRTEGLKKELIHSSLALGITLELCVLDGTFVKHLVLGALETSSSSPYKAGRKKHRPLCYFYV